MPLPQGSWNLQFLSQHYYILGLSDLCLGVERKIFKKYINFTLFTAKLPPLGVGGHLKLLVSLPYICHIPNVVKIGPVVLEKMMLTHDAQCTMHDRRWWMPTHSNTVPTRPNLTPVQTSKVDPGFALNSLGVRCGSTFQKSASTLGPLGVHYASALGGSLCALMCEADPALLLPPLSPAPCIFQIHCPAVVEIKVLNTDRRWREWTWLLICISKYINNNISMPYPTENNIAYPK